MICSNCDIALGSSFYQAGKNGSEYCSIECCYEAYEGFYTRKEVDRTIIHVKKAPEQKKEVEYECLIEAPGRSITVSVFTTSTDKEVIKGKALTAASEHLKEFGVDHDMKDLKPIGYKKLGYWKG